MRILIDADGCPVVDNAIKIAKEYNVETIIICDTSHNITRDGAKTINVAKGADSVDFALLKILLKDDIVITQDYGLAAMCLSLNAVVINQDGMVFNNSNMDSLLMKRYTVKKIISAGGRLKGNPKRIITQNKLFEFNLQKILREYYDC